MDLDISKTKNKVGVKDLLQSELHPEQSATGKFICPWHDDHEPSLAYSRERNRLYCFGACSNGAGPKQYDHLDILMKSRGVGFREAQNLLRRLAGGGELPHFPEPAPRRRGPLRPVKRKPTAPFVIDEVYDYRDRDHRLLYQVVRLKPKDFRQRRSLGGGWTWNMKNQQRVLFRLPQIAHTPRTTPILFVEGERDVFTAERLGFVATCNPGGAGKFPGLQKLYDIRRPLWKRTVWIIPDNDDVGLRHAEDVRAALEKWAGEVMALPPVSDLPGGDLTDLFLTIGKEEARKYVMRMAREAGQTP